MKNTFSVLFFVIASFLFVGCGTPYMESHGVILGGGWGAPKYVEVLNFVETQGVEIVDVYVNGEVWKQAVPTAFPYRLEFRDHSYYNNRYTYGGGNSVNIIIRGSNPQNQSLSDSRTFRFYGGGYESKETAEEWQVRLRKQY